MIKVAKEVAVQEFERWLSYKGIRDKKRKDNESFEETIIAAIEDGQLTLDDDHVFTLKITPVKDANGSNVLESLKFKPRLQVYQLNQKLKGVSANDGDGRVMAYVAAITNENSGVIGLMDTSEYSVCQSIVMYFL